MEGDIYYIWLNFHNERVFSDINRWYQKLHFANLLIGGNKTEKYVESLLGTIISLGFHILILASATNPLQKLLYKDIQLSLLTKNSFILNLIGSGRSFCNNLYPSSASSACYLYAAGKVSSWMHCYLLRR